MALKEVLAIFDIKVNDEELAEGEKRLQGFTAKLNAAAIAAAGAAGAVAFGAFNLAQVRLGREIALNSDRLGISTDRLQEYAYAAGLAGRETDDVVDAISTLQERARDAWEDPKSDPAVQLRLLGVEALDASGKLKDADTLFMEVADGLKGLGTQTDRVGAAMTLFGDVGRELLPVLQDGSVGLQEMFDEARSTGAIMSGTLVKSSAEAAVEIQKLEATFQGLKNSLFAVTLPLFTRLASAARTVMRVFATWAKETTIVQSALEVMGAIAIALGIKVLAAWAPVIGTFLFWAGILAAIVLVFDDLKALWTGGQSAIGGLIDEMLGLGTAAAGVEDTVKLFKQLWQFVTDTWYVMKEMVAAFHSGFLANFTAGIDIIRDFTGASRARGRNSGGRVSPNAANGGGVTSNVSVSVTGSSDPNATGVAVANEVQRANRRALSQAKRSLTSRAAQ